MAINTLGTSIADDFATKLTTPENLSVLVRSGTVRNAADNISSGRMASLANFDAANVFAVIGRITPVEPVEFSLTLCPGENAGSIRMYLRGHWKLPGIALPPRVIAAMVDRLPAR